MKRIFQITVPAAVVAISIIAAATAWADDGHGDGHGEGRHNAYVVTKLVSDLSGPGIVNPPNGTPDPNLKNPWGIAFSPAGSPFWIADNGTGLSTLYDGAGNRASFGPFVIPPPAGSSAGTAAAPTGIVWNPAAQFVVPNTTIQAAFIFATEDGTISAWARGLNPANQAVLAVDFSKGGHGAPGGVAAVYKGLAFGVNANGPFLFATNFRAGTVDVFGPDYKLAKTDGQFQDTDIPPGFAPFGIQNINGDLFVSYAKQNAAKHDDVAGPGNGFVDVFDTDGHLLRRFASRAALNSPWGMMRASYAFGEASARILIGNFGDGHINVFSSRGEFRGQLHGTGERPIAINGLWTITPGGGANSSPDTLYFTAGTNDEADGTFGTITPASH